MREIEFRAKCKKSNKWVYGAYLKHLKRTPCAFGDQIDAIKDYEHLIINSGFSDWNMPKPIDCYRVEEKTVGQFSELKDKNGNKIFAGDILKYTRTNWYCPGHPKHNTDLVQICEVFFCEEHHAFREKGKYDTGGGWEGFLTFEDDRAKENIIEIIGNIHDNPELLEGVK